MLIKSAKLINFPVLSFQTSSEIAKTKDIIVNPDNLKIVGFHLEGNLLPDPKLILRLADIRELSNIGMIIDSIDELIMPEDIIKISNILKYNFYLNNFQVIDTENNKIGKIIDYTINLQNFYVQQLIVKRPFYKALNNSELLINRTDLVEINDKAIVIKNEKEKKREYSFLSHNFNKKTLDPYSANDL